MIFSEYPPSQEYPEYGSILINCSSSVYLNFKLWWEICLDGTVRTLCARPPRDKQCDSSTDPQFFGRIQYADAATIRVVNMTREDSAPLSCYRGYDNNRTHKYTAVIVGNNIYEIFNFKSIYLHNTLGIHILTITRNIHF